MLQAVKSQEGTQDSVQRGDQMKEALLKRLNHLRNFPYALGKLTVRSLLELCNQLLVLYEFNDTYLEVRYQNILIGYLAPLWKKKTGIPKTSFSKIISPNHFLRPPYFLIHSFDDVLIL